MRRDAFVCVFHRSRRRRMDQRWRIGDRVEARYRAGTTPAVLLPTGEAGWYPGEVVDVRVDVSGAATYDIQYDDGSRADITQEQEGWRRRDGGDFAQE